MHNVNKHTNFIFFEFLQFLSTFARNCDCNKFKIVKYSNTLEYNSKYHGTSNYKFTLKIITGYLILNIISLHFTSLIY